MKKFALLAAFAALALVGDASAQCRSFSGFNNFVLVPVPQRRVFVPVNNGNSLAIANGRNAQAIAGGFGSGFGGGVGGSLAFSQVNRGPLGRVRSSTALTINNGGGNAIANAGGGRRR